MHNKRSISLTSIGNGIGCTKLSAQRSFTNKLKRCCLFLMLWKNAKFCKGTRVSDKNLKEDAMLD